MPEGWLLRIVDDFWGQAGPAPPFPRDLESAVLWTLPLAIIRLPQLWLRDVSSWLSRHELPVPIASHDRPLRGCLVAYGGNGMVFQLGTDSDDERRFTLAHEVAHFLLDYHLPRQHLSFQFGPAILEVLDGHRLPTPAEQISAIVTGLSFGIHTHLLDRRDDGTAPDSTVVSLESRADRLALELLAPADAVRQLLPPGSESRCADPLSSILVSTFGLPITVARPYARWLQATWRSGTSFREWLGVR